MCPLSMLLSHITGTRLEFIPHPVLPPPAVHPSEQHDEAPFCFQHVSSGKDFLKTTNSEIKLKHEA